MIQQACVEGVSTRRVDDLIKALGCDGISKSQVSRICQELDEVVESFLGRSLDDYAHPYLWLDALTQKVRETGRIVNVSDVVATAVNAGDQREILGMDVGTGEDGAFWLAFLRSLNARGLSGVELVISDAHHGLQDAIATVFAGATWQRCRTHFMTNLLTRVPKRAVLSLSKGWSGHHGAHHLPADHGRGGPCPAGPGGVATARTLPAGCGHAGGRRSRHPGILAFTGFPVAH